MIGCRAISLVRWPSLEEMKLHSMESLAKSMVALIQAIQHSGPYRLAGYSSGGILAYAITQQLLGMDESVSFLGLIDVSQLATSSIEIKNTARGALLEAVGDASTHLRR